MWQYTFNDAISHQNFVFENLAELENATLDDQYHQYQEIVGNLGKISDK